MSSLQGEASPREMASKADEILDAAIKEAQNCCPPRQYDFTDILNPDRFKLPGGGFLLSSDEIKSIENGDPLPDPVSDSEDENEAKPLPEPGEIRTDDNIRSVGQYFGDKWVETHILSHHQVPPIETPSHFAAIPRPWQLRGAAQIHYMCKSIFQGGMCADESGLGKTLLAILVMELARSERGSFSLVVCPASSRSQWKAEILNAYKEEHKPKVYILEDSMMSAHHILEQQYDIIIVSYNFLAKNYQDLKGFPEDFKKYRRCMGPRPNRPVSALLTHFWRDLKLPFKRVILDDCHRIKNENGDWFLAAKALYRRATVMLSGTILSKNWQDIFAPVSLLNGQPFHTRKEFMNAFAPGDDSRGSGLTKEGMVYLQRLLLAVLIARPSTQAGKEESLTTTWAGPLVRKDEDPLVIPHVHSVSSGLKRPYDERD